MTARSLETMIRLATAHSKLRHSRKIERADVEVAQQLMLRIIDQSRTIEAGDGTPDGQEHLADELEDDFEGAAPAPAAVAGGAGPATRASGKAVGSRCVALRRAGAVVASGGLSGASCMRLLCACGVYACALMQLLMQGGMLCAMSFTRIDGFWRGKAIASQNDAASL